MSHIPKPEKTTPNYPPDHEQGWRHWKWRERKLRHRMRGRWQQRSHNTQECNRTKQLWILRKKGIACHDNWIQLLLLLLIQGLHCLRCIKQFEVFQPAPIALFESVFDFHSSFYAFAQIVFIKWEVVFVQIVVIVAIDLKVERRRI